MNKDQENHLDEKNIDLTQFNDAKAILKGLPGKESKETILAIKRACALNGNAKLTNNNDGTVEFTFKNGATGTYSFSKSDGVSTTGDGFTYHGIPVQDVKDKETLNDMAKDIHEKNPELDKNEIKTVMMNASSGSETPGYDGSAENTSANDGKGTGSGEGSGSASGEGSGERYEGSSSASGEGSSSGEVETPEGGETQENGDAPIEGETLQFDRNTSALVEFFTDPKVLIGVATVGSIISMFAILSKSIKARFRKTAKSLYRLQKDFGGSPEGLDMDNAFKGQGSRIIDILVKVFGFGKKGKGAIGLVPFVKNYQDEIKRDYISAEKAYNMVSQAGKDQQTAEIDSEKNESINIPTYKSFIEAYNARKLNESAYSGEELNEGVVATISSAMLLGKLSYSAGRFIWHKMGKDGKMEPAQAVQVTKQSTREVCYSIMNCFFSKYFNMEGVSTKLGLDINHLSDIDKSNVDKFKKLVASMKNEQKDNERVSKMYTRVHKQYNEMLKRYFTIANKVVDNFETYSKKDKTGKAKQLSEKEQNLLTSGAEKLRMEISRQHDLYENNFFRVVNAIVASPEYIQYMDFIIENVIPVFETGNAGDADYVLNTMPRKNEYFLVRQTKNSTELPNPNTIDMRNGNVALVMVEEVNTGENKGAPIVKFKRVGLFKSIKGDAKVKIQDDGTVDYGTIDENNVTLDTKAYAKDVDGKEGGDSLSLEYSKWLAIDPIQVVNYKPKEGDNPTPADDNAAIGMQRQYNDNEELIFIIPAEDEQKSEGRDTTDYQPDLAVNENGEEGTGQGDVKKVKIIEFVTKNEKGNVINVITPKDEMSVEAVKNLLKGDAITDDKFKEIPSNDIQGKKEDASKIQNKVESVNKTQEEIIAIINHSGENSDENNTTVTKDDVVKNLKNDIATISENVYKSFNNVLSNIQNLTIRVYNRNSGEGSATTAKLLRAKSLPIIDTGVVTTANHKLVVVLDIYSPNSKGKNIDMNNSAKTIAQYKNVQGGIETITDSSTGTSTALVYKNAFVIRMFFTILDDNNKPVTPSDGTLNVGKGTAQLVNSGSNILDDETFKAEITKCINELILRYGSADSYIKETKDNTLKENIVISYSVSNMNESYNSVSIKRDMIFENSKSMYVLSTFAWGDGTILNPSNYVKESIETIINKANDYYDIASIAKKDKSVKLVPMSESLIYNIPMPHNRYDVLTDGNPLYEAVAVIKVDESANHNIVASQFIGVNSITK